MACLVYVLSWPGQLGRPRQSSRPGLRPCWLVPHELSTQGMWASSQLWPGSFEIIILQSGGIYPMFTVCPDIEVSKNMGCNHGAFSLMKEIYIGQKS